MATTNVYAPTENQFLDFSTSRVQSITLDQLQRTHEENDVYGNPLKGMYHHQIIATILQMCNEFGYDTEVYDMFAAQNKDGKQPGVVLLPQVEAIKGEKAVEAHILRRVFTNIRIKDFDNDERTTNLSIAFHQKGIQVGFGRNVVICHNQCMLNADLYAATYSERGRDNRMELPNILDAIRGWLQNARTLMEKDESIIQQMKAIDVPAEQTIQIIGLLTATRVKADTLIKEIREPLTYPLNQAQITQFTEKLLLDYQQNQRVTVWDMYNAATDLYKATSMDMPSILTQNRAMIEFLQNQFNFAA